jgi:hypothetical protein
MEEKKANQSHIGQKESTAFSIKEISFFKDNPFYLYLYKKNQKICSAIYSLTDFIEDREPIKWSMRNLSLKIVSKSMSLSEYDLLNISGDKRQIILSLTSTLLELESIFEIAVHQKLLSDMNFTIIKNELDTLIQLINEREQPLPARSGFILTEDMLKTEEEKQLPGKQYEKLLFNSVQSVQHQQQNIHPPKLFFKGQKKDMTFLLSSGVPLDNNSQSKLVSDASNTHEEVVQNFQKKDERREMIISLLQGGKQLTINDFSQEIMNCSEKTIQRELLLLVSSGLLKKIGERRWSRYALA